MSNILTTAQEQEVGREHLISDNVEAALARFNALSEEVIDEGEELLHHCVLPQIVIA